MAITSTEPKFRRHEKVVANIDLPAVPAGTPGKVLLPTGVSWFRYRVLFGNGVERGSLDERHLVRPKEFVPLDQRVEVEAAADGAAADETGGDAPAAAAADKAFGVPAHLLERSRKARERLGAA
jgi:hypothetical protein